jgi:hypothetical protein
MRVNGHGSRRRPVSEKVEPAESDMVSTTFEADPQATGSPDKPKHATAGLEMPCATTTALVVPAIVSQ